MTPQATIENIRQARSRIQAALAGCAVPQIEMMLRNADQELHLALWNLGEPVALRAELEYPDLEQGR